MEQLMVGEALLEAGASPEALPYIHKTIPPFHFRFHAFDAIPDFPKMMICSLQYGSGCRYRVALLEAVQSRLPNTARALLEAGTAACASADGQDKSSEDGPQAARFCARGGDHQTAERLTLNAAVKDFTIQILDCLPERIWESSRVDEEYVYKYTPLHCVVVTGKLQTAERLLERGADVRARTTRGKEPLHCALSSQTLLNDDTRVQAARLLLRYGADPNCSDLEENPHGNLVINDAALFGGRNVLEVMIENGGILHACNTEGRGPLHYARDADTVNYLLEHWIDPHMEDSGGRVALHSISSLGRFSAVEALLPIYNGDVRDNEGVSALHLAAGYGHTPVVNALLTKIDDADIVDSRGCTPLHFAAMNKPKLKFADTSSVDMVSESVISDQLAVATLLLNRGADPNKHTFGKDILNHTSGNESSDELVLAQVSNQTPDKKCSEEIISPDVSNLSTDNLDSENKILADVSNETSDNEGFEEMDFAEDLTSEISDNEGSEEMVVSLHTVNRSSYGEVAAGCTPLHCAVGRGKMDMAQLLLKHNACINSTDAVGRTALHLASQRCDPELVKFLLDEGADPSALDCKQQAPLHYIFFWRTLLDDSFVYSLVNEKRDPYNLDSNDAEKKPHDVARLLLEHKANIEQEDAEGRSALHLAMLRGNSEIVQVLLGHGANPLNLSHGKQGPLSVFLKTYSLDTHIIIKPLLIAGEDPNFQDKKGNAPLHHAARRGKVEEARILLEFNANVDQKNAEGLTPLHLAIKYRHRRLIDLLLDHGANPLALDNENQEPINYVFESGVCDYELVKRLVNMGADPNRPDENGNSPLHHAAVRRLFQMVKFLLHHNASVNSKDSEGFTALHHALYAEEPEWDNYSDGAREMEDYVEEIYVQHEREFEIVQLLLKHNAAVDEKDAEGCTPLHLASRNSNQKVVQLLLDNRSNPLAIDNKQQGPINYLYGRRIWAGAKGILEVLLKAGANPNSLDVNGNSPLHLAAKRRHVEEVELLLMYNASIDERDGQGRIALHLAIENTDRAMVELLLNYGANPLILDSGQQGCVNYAFKNEECDSALLEILLNAGADPNLIDAGGSAPLHHAVRRRECEAVRLLLKHNASVNMKDSSGRCAVHLAVSSNIPESNEILVTLPLNDIFVNEKAVDRDKEFEIVRLLLEYNADIEETDAVGRTALEIASQNKDQRVVDLLVENAAKR